MDTSPNPESHECKPPRNREKSGRCSLQVDPNGKAADPLRMSVDGWPSPSSKVELEKKLSRFEGHPGTPGNKPQNGHVKRNQFGKPMRICQTGKV